MIDTIEIKWDLLGARLANLSDIEQGAFFHGFAQELGHYESIYKAQMQMAFVADKLSKEDKSIFKETLMMLCGE